MISSLFDFFVRKKKEENQAIANAASPAFVVDRAGVRKAVSGLDAVLGLTKDATPSRTTSKAAIHNVHLNKDYHLCGGKYIEKGVRLVKPKEELMPVDVVYNGYLAGANTVKLRKGEGNNENWASIQNMDMVKTSEGYHVASILIKKPATMVADTHNMHVAFYTDDDGQENWDNNKGQNFSFAIPMMSAQASAASSTQNNGQANSQQGAQKSSNIINNLLGITPKKQA